MTYKFKRIMSLLLALVMLMSMTACGKDEVEEEEGGMTIDPNQSSVAVKAADTVFTLAVDLDPDYNVMYNIITQADTENGVSWMLKIDSSVTFHDGSNVTAEDVAYSIDQARKSDIYGARLNKIWGISHFNSSDQVMISLSDVNYLFPRCLNIPIIKKGSDSTMPEGTGQYMFDTDMTKLVKYEDHRYAENTPLDVIYLHDNGTPDEKMTPPACLVWAMALRTKCVTLLLPICSTSASICPRNSLAMPRCVWRCAMLWTATTL